MIHGSLRVLHLTTSFPQISEDFSGLFVLRLAQELENIGVSENVLTPAGLYPSSWPEALKIYRFQYAPRAWQQLANRPGGIPQALNQNLLLYTFLPNFLLSMAIHLVRLARHCDLIHAHWSVCGALAVLTQLLHGKPVITTLGGTDALWAKKRRPYAWLHKKSITGSCFTVGVSRKIVTELQEQHPKLSHRFAFIPNGVNEAFYAIPPFSRPPLPPLNLLFVGSLIPTKGVDSLLSALAHLDTTYEWRLTIAGDGPENNRLVNLGERYHLSKKISFLRTVPPEKVPSLMADHHVLILPSNSEGRPNVVLEAMAAGLPVVGTDIDGIRELVQAGRTGWIVPPGDSGTLADVLRSLIRGERDYVMAGNAGRAWMIEQGLTWSETARRYCELYERAITDKKCMSRKK